MDKLAEIVRRFAFLFRRQRFDSELEEEIRFHLDMKLKEYQSGTGSDLSDSDSSTRQQASASPSGPAGSTIQDLGSLAAREFGNQTLVIERSRDVWLLASIENLFKDVRFAVRTLKRNPAFTITALAVLTVGIGASTAVFSAVDAVLIKPLPVQDQSRIVLTWKRDTRSNNPVQELSIPEFRDWQAQNTVFSSCAALPTSVYGYGYTVTGLGEAFQVESAKVSADFFTVLGVAPEFGRTFAKNEDLPEGPLTVVLSHALWQKHFNSDPAMIGRILTMNGDAYRVVGIMPADFDFPHGASVWTPLSSMSSAATNRGAVFLQVMGRLKPGVTLNQVQPDLDRIIANVNRQYPKTRGDQAIVTPLSDYVLGNAKPALLLLMAAVALLLLIACINVAGLLLTRASSRKREFALRCALGAGRQRLVRQLLTESLVLASLGGILGAGLAVWAIGLFKRLSPADVPGMAAAHVNGPALAFAATAALISAIVFGMVPALSASKLDLSQSLKDVRSSASLGALRLRSALIASEIAVTLALTIAAALVAISYHSLENVDLGFDPSNVVTAEVSLRGPAYDTAAKRREWYRQLMQRLESHHETSTAGMVLVRPLEGTIGWDVPYQAEGQTEADVPGNPVPNYEIITPHYFRAMGIRMIAGRDFSEQDTDKSEPVVIISRSMSVRCFDTADAVGRRIKVGSFEPDSPWSTVVGVVADARYRALDDQRLDMYVPYTQRAFPARYVMIRTSGPTSDAALILRKEVAELDSTQAVSSLTTVREMTDDALARPRFSMILLVVFASIAAFLAMAGVYGVMSYTVGERTREIGIRMALGARSGRVRLAVTSDVLKVAMAGVCAGILISIAGMRLMSGLLYGVRPTNVLVFGGTSLLLIAAAIGAAYFPARRASKVDPALALRCD